MPAQGPMPNFREAGSWDALQALLEPVLLRAFPSATEDDASNAAGDILSAADKFGEERAFTAFKKTARHFPTIELALMAVFNDHVCMFEEQSSCGCFEEAVA
jgi:hypothetical protein